MSDPTQQEQLDRLLTLEQPLQGLESPTAARRPVFEPNDVVTHAMFGRCLVVAVDELGDFPVYALRAMIGGRLGGQLFRASAIFLS